MADAVIHIADGESHCRIVDPVSGTLQVPLREISQQGALVDTRMQFEAQAAVDLTVVLKGLSPRQFFANVAFSDNAGLHLQWMPIDSGEQARLHSLLEAYKTLHPPQAAASTEAAAPAREKTNTRRVIRPKGLAADSSSAIMPFTDVSTPPSTPVQSSTQSSSQLGSGERVRTRRIVRPSNQSLPRVDDAPADDDATVKTTPAKGANGDNTPSTLSIFREETGAQRVLDEDSGDHLADTEPSTGKAGVVGADGRMDIGASIRNKAKSIRASELAARHDRVRVLNMGTIKQLITEAVEEASAHLTRSLGAEDRKRLLEEAEENFKERLKMFEAEKLTAEVKAKQLVDQLRTAQDLLESERKRTVKADQFTVSAAGLDEIELKFKRLLDHSIAEGRVIPTLEEELRRVIATVFDQERQRIREQEMQAQNEKIQLLETKIKRLASSLDETERQRDEMQEWAQTLEASGGGALRNIMSAGIRDDGNKKRKMALMKEILDINRAMRKELGIETAPVDEETEEAIKKVEAASKLTPEEEAAIREQRKRIDPLPEAKKPDAEMLNVMAESGHAPAASANPDDEPFEAVGTVKAAAGVKKLSAEGAEEVPEGAEIDPDDMEWTPAAKAGPVTGNDSGIKKIATTTDFKLPPLQKKGKK